MKALQKKMGARPAVNDLDLTGFEIQPLNVIVGTAVFVLSVILLHFYSKLGGAKP
ncbi:putative Sec61beta family [Trypanosoma cruzi]|nr:putative Sec61beta family [Trypanosoma cruzi]